MEENGQQILSLPAIACRLTQHIWLAQRTGIAIDGLRNHVTINPLWQHSCIAILSQTLGIASVHPERVLRPLHDIASATRHARTILVVLRSCLSRITVPHTAPRRRDALCSLRKPNKRNSRVFPASDFGSAMTGLRIQRP